MARIVLTTDEKAILRQSTRFREQVKGAMMNHAEFLTTQDQTGAATQAARETWAKQRYFGTNRLLQSPNIFETDRYTEMALNNAKNIPVRDDAVNPFDIDNTIDYMIAQGTFETLAIDAFNFEIDIILF